MEAVGRKERGVDAVDTRAAHDSGNSGAGTLLVALQLLLPERGPHPQRLGQAGKALHGWQLAHKDGRMACGLSNCAQQLGEVALKAGTGGGLGDVVGAGGDYDQVDRKGVRWGITCCVISRVVAP